MLKSPLAYFGNRGELQDDIFKLIEQQKGQKKYRRCYDLFAGSASMSLQAIQLNLAEEYIINDAYGALAHFWQQVKEAPEALIEVYRQVKELFDSEVDKPVAYQKLQASFNQQDFENPAEQAALFAFLINHAQGGIPTLDKAGQKLSCSYAAGHVQAEVSHFTVLVQKLHEAFTRQGIKVDFQAKNFSDFKPEEITTEDLVLLDPPYPDMQDAEEAPESHIYHRPENKLALQANLKNLIDYFQQHQVPFLMFYGVQGMKNPCPMHLPEQHYLRMAGGLNHPYGEYVENVYVSKHFIPYLKAVYLPRLIRWDLSLAEAIARENDYHAVAKLIKDKISDYAAWNQPFPLLFERWAQERALYPALVLTDDSKVSYGELNDQVNRLAQYLKANYDLKPGKLVAIVVGEMRNFVTCILALWKLRAAYVPMSAQEGVNVIKETVKSAQAVLCLMTGAYELPALDIPVVELPAPDILANYKTSNPDEAKNLSPEDLAYVMYTSGSTGEPKGAAILHKGLPYCLKAHQDILELKPEDNVAQIAKVGFDASLMEILMALGSGACLHFVEPNIRDNNSCLTTFFNERQISQVILVPSKLKTLTPNDFPSLKGLVVTGEPFDEALVNPWLKERIIVNGYGLTETTICTTLGRYTGNGLTIGKPIIGTRMYLQGASEGQEIYIAGMSLAKGYWQDEERSKERFVEIEDHQFGQKTLAYRSGDIGLQLANGEYQIIGRVDNQLKLRGQRLEPEHIEAKLKSFYWQNALVIKEACVVSAEPKEREKHLVAYLVPKQPGSDIPVTKIHHYLKEQLPGFMVPNAIAWQEALPLNKNGKIDRKALAASRPIPFLSSTTKIAPKTNAEKTIAGYWGEVLGCDTATIYRDDDFFCLGGSSVTLSPLLKKLSKHFPLAADLQPAEIYNYSRLDQLARLVSASPLKALNQKPAKPRLYLVHSLLGDGWSEYQALANQLPFAVYAYRARGLDEQEEKIESISELAEDYVGELLRNEATLKQQGMELGPLVVGGWSSGGIVALSMAEQLKKKGYVNVNVILLDTDYPDMPGLDAPLTLGKILAQQLYQAEARFDEKIRGLTLGEEFSERCDQVFATLNVLKADKKEENRLAWIKSFYLAEIAYIQQWCLCDGLPLTVLLAENNAAMVSKWQRYKVPSQVIANTHHFNLLESCQEPLKKTVSDIYLNVAAANLLEQLKAKYRQPIRYKRWLTGEEWDVNKENCLSLNLQKRDAILALSKFEPNEVTLLQSLLVKGWEKIKTLKPNKDDEYKELVFTEQEVFSLKKILDKDAHPNAKAMGEKLMQIKKTEQERFVLSASLNYEELLDEKQRHVVLKGGAGTGKTILTELLTVLWSQGQLWQVQKFILVLRLPLRKLSSWAEKRLSLARIVYYEYLGETIVPSELELLEKLLQQQVEKIAWVLDGFDEVTHFYSQESPPGKMLKLLLSQSYVLVTSRFWYEEHLKSFIRIENDALSPTVSDAYIKLSLKEKSQDFKMLTDKIPALKPLLQVPLLLELLVCLYQQSQLEAQEESFSRVVIYQKMTESLFKANWRSERDKIVQVKFLLSYEGILQQALQTLAFESFVQGQRGMVMGKSIAELSQSLSKANQHWLDTCLIKAPVYWKENLPTLSPRMDEIMKRIERCALLQQTYYALDIQQKRYDFVHLSFQEYLVACYWVDNFIENRGNIVLFKNRRWNENYEAVWLFVMGLLRKKSGTHLELLKGCLTFFVPKQKAFDKLTTKQLFQLTLYWAEAGMPAMPEWGETSLLERFKQKMQHILQFEHYSLSRNDNVFVIFKKLPDALISEDDLLSWLKINGLSLSVQNTLVELLVRKPEASAERLLQWLQIEKLGWHVKYWLAKALSQKPAVTIEHFLQGLQIKYLERTVLSDALTIIVDDALQGLKTRDFVLNPQSELAKGLVQKPEATAEHFLQGLQIEGLGAYAQSELVKGLAQKPEVTAEHLLQGLQVRGLETDASNKLAEALAQKSLASVEHLLQGLQVEKLGAYAQNELAKRLTQKPEVTAEYLLQCLQIEGLGTYAQSELAKGLAQKPEVTAEHLLQGLQIEELGGYAQSELAKGLAQKPEVTAEHLLQGLQVRGLETDVSNKLAEALAQKSSASVEHLLQGLRIRKLGENTQIKLANVLVQKPSTSVEHLLQGLQIKDLDRGAHYELAKGLKQKPEITVEQLLQGLQIRQLEKDAQYDLAKVLSQKPSASVHNLLQWLQMKELGWHARNKLAEILARKPLASAEHLLEGLQIKGLSEDAQGELAKGIAQKPDVTAEHLLQWLRIEKLGVYAQYELAKGLVQKPEATAEYLLQWLQVKELGWYAKNKLAEALAQKPAATAEHLIQILQIKELAESVQDELAEALAQKPAVTAEQLLQVLQIRDFGWNTQNELAKRVAQKPEVTVVQLLQGLQIKELRESAQSELAEALVKKHEVTVGNLLQGLEVEWLLGDIQCKLAEALTKKPEVTLENLQQGMKIEGLWNNARGKLAEALAKKHKDLIASCEKKQLYSGSISHETIQRLCRKNNIIIAIANVDIHQQRTTYYYIDNSEEKFITTEDKNTLPEKPILKLAYTGKDWMLIEQSSQSEFLLEKNKKTLFFYDKNKVPYINLLVNPWEKVFDSKIGNYPNGKRDINVPVKEIKSNQAFRLICRLKK